jgi:flavodoxin
MNWTRRKLLLAASAAGAAMTLPRLAAAQADTRSLIVYYSRTGNTQAVVDYIAGRIGCDAIEIETRDAYPEDYDTLVALVRQQAAEGYLPPLASPIDLSDYDRVFVGSPIWGNRLSRPVHSFLASHDLSGKIVAPFVTYEVSSSGGQAPGQLQQLCPTSDLRELLTILGETAENDGREIGQWLDETVAG